MAQQYKALLLALILLSANLLTGVAYAHDARPLFVQMTEMGELTFTIELKVPLTLSPESIPIIDMPAGCVADDKAVLQRISDGYFLRRLYRCSFDLAGEEIAILYPAGNPSLSTLFKINRLDGQVISRLLPPGEPRFRVPEKEDSWTIGKQYVGFGITHIFSGIDHLLFVACLVFIAGTRRRILITITGFTLAHSLTLALSSLNLVSLPVPPVEAVIALSILFLAHEIAVDNRQSWTWQYPVAVSSSFGLLHGFGFAAVLGEIGLPQTEKSMALLAFNLGVELGQILFLLCLAAIFAMASHIVADGSKLALGRFGQKGAGYVIGTVASFWMIQRLALF